jgi:hypothetical protein
MAHCAMKINQPKTPPIATRAKGVYDPAIKIKIDEWSIIFRIPAALVNEKLWYKVEAKYRAHIEMPYTTYEKISILFWFSTPLRIRKTVATIERTNPMPCVTEFRISFVI